jgi:hypothetical protein
MSFRQYGGTNYASTNNIVKNKYTNSSNLSVMKIIGQPNSVINSDSDISIHGNLLVSGNLTVNLNLLIYGNITVSGSLTVNSLIFSNGTTQTTAYKSLGPTGTFNNTKIVINSYGQIDSISDGEVYTGPTGLQGDKYLSPTLSNFSPLPAEGGTTTVTVNNGLAYITGNSIIVTATASPLSNRFEGTVQNYNSNTGVLIIYNIVNFMGSIWATNTPAIVNLDGIDGPTGPTGITGPSNPNSTAILLSNNSISSNSYITFATGPTGYNNLNTSSGLTYNPNTSALIIGGTGTSLSCPNANFIIFPSAILKSLSSLIGENSTNIGSNSTYRYHGNNGSPEDSFITNYAYAGSTVFYNVSASSTGPTGPTGSIETLRINTTSITAYEKFIIQSAGTGGAPLLSIRDTTYNNNNTINFLPNNPTGTNYNTMSQIGDDMIFSGGINSNTGSSLLLTTFSRSLSCGIRLNTLNTPSLVLGCGGQSSVPINNITFTGSTGPTGSVTISSASDITLLPSITGPTGYVNIKQGNLKISNPIYGPNENIVNGYFNNPNLIGSSIGGQINNSVTLVSGTGSYLTSEINLQNGVYIVQNNPVFRVGPTGPVTINSGRLGMNSAQGLFGGNSIVLGHKTVPANSYFSESGIQATYTYPGGTGVQMLICYDFTGPTGTTIVSVGGSSSLSGPTGTGFYSFTRIA